MNALLRMLAWTLAIALVALQVVAFVNGWVGVGRWPLRTLRVEQPLQIVEHGKVWDIASRVRPFRPHHRLLQLRYDVVTPCAQAFVRLLQVKGGVSNFLCHALA